MSTPRTRFKRSELDMFQMDFYLCETCHNPIWRARDKATRRKVPLELTPLEEEIGGDAVYERHFCKQEE